MNLSFGQICTRLVKILEGALVGNQVFPFSTVPSKLQGTKFEKNEKFWAKFYNFSLSLVAVKMMFG